MKMTPCSSLQQREISQYQAGGVPLFAMILVKAGPFYDSMHEEMVAQNVPGDQAQFLLQKAITIARA